METSRRKNRGQEPRDSKSFGFAERTSPRLQSSVVSQSNDKALVMLDERREQLELVSFAVHYVNKACRVADSFCRLQRSIQPTLRFAIWVMQALHAFLPVADLRAVSDQRLQAHRSKRSTISCCNDGKMCEKTLQVVRV